MHTNSGAWSKTAKGYQILSKHITLKHGIHAIQASGLQSDIEKKKENLRVLDIACGPGDLGVEIARLATESKTKLIMNSTDFAEEMIKLADENSSNYKDICQNLVMDGNKLDFEDESFNYVYSMFGVFFFPERKKSMKEIYRTLKNGGKVSIAVWEDFPHAMKETLEELGKPPGPSYSHINNTELLVSDLKECGFDNIELFNHTAISYFDNIDDLFEGARANPGMLEKDEEFVAIYYKNFVKKFSLDGKTADFKTCSVVAVAEKS